MSRDNVLGWQTDAACDDTPIEWWYPPNDGGHGVPDEARACCDICPVRPTCLDHALRHERHGVWAGTSERGRVRLRRAMNIRLDTIELDPVKQYRDQVIATMQAADATAAEIGERLGVTRAAIHNRTCRANAGATA